VPALQYNDECNKMETRSASQSTSTPNTKYQSAQQQIAATPVSHHNFSSSLITNASQIESPKNTFAKTNFAILHGIQHLADSFLNQEQVAKLKFILDCNRLSIITNTYEKSVINQIFRNNI